MGTSLITLTTDFGVQDPYVGLMKGVILGISPRASIVDISHHVGPQAILEASFIIGGSYRYFPDGTIHVVVVDPGVGTSRNALLLVTPSARFLAPDNGVLSHVLKEGIQEENGRPDLPEGDTTAGRRVSLPQGYRAYRLTNPEFWLHPVSSTFHGRDIFSPVAAHLSLGVPPHRLGREVRQVTFLPIGPPQWDGDMLAGRIVHIDHFGNLITDIPADLLPRQDSIFIEVKGRRVQGMSPSYAEAYTEGEGLLAIIGSYGTLEVAVKNGNAAQSLQANIGDAVLVERR